MMDIVETTAVRASFMDLVERDMCLNMPAAPRHEVNVIPQDTQLDGFMSTFKKYNAIIRSHQAALAKKDMDEQKSFFFPHQEQKGLFLTSIDTKMKEGLASLSPPMTPTTATPPQSLGGRPEVDECVLQPNATTLLVKNIPTWLRTPKRIMQKWAPDGTYDYLEVPFNAREGSYKACAILNFTSHEHAVAFASQWHGVFLDPEMDEPMTIDVAKHQGVYANLLHRYRGKDIDRLHRHQHLPLLWDRGMRTNTRQVLQDMGITA